MGRPQPLKRAFGSRLEGALFISRLMFEGAKVAFPVLSSDKESCALSSSASRLPPSWPAPEIKPSRRENSVSSESMRVSGICVASTLPERSPPDFTATEPNILPLLCVRSGPGRRSIFQADPRQYQTNQARTHRYHRR